MGVYEAIFFDLLIGSSDNHIGLVGIVVVTFVAFFSCVVVLVGAFGVVVTFVAFFSPVVVLVGTFGVVVTFVTFFSCVVVLVGAFGVVVTFVTFFSCVVVLVIMTLFTVVMSMLMIVAFFAMVMTVVVTMCMLGFGECQNHRGNGVDFAAQPVVVTAAVADDERSFGELGHVASAGFEFVRVDGVVGDKAFDVHVVVLTDDCFRDVCPVICGCNDMHHRAGIWLR